MRGDHVEPGIAQERSSRDGRDHRQKRRPKGEREHRRSERQRQEQVEPHPRDVPVVGHVPLRQGRAQVDDPGEERDDDGAEQQDEPEPITPRQVHLANCAERAWVGA